MSFSSLSKHIESLSNDNHPFVVIDRDITPFILSNTAQDEIAFYELDLDPQKSLGHFKQSTIAGGAPYDSDSAIFLYEVRYAKALNLCWRRFVCCKEVLHIFDRESERSDTREKFLQLAKEMAVESPTRSAMYSSEIEAMWKAMAILAPRRLRDKYKADYDSGTISDYELALNLRMPEFYIPQIMSSAFDVIIDSLVKTDASR